MIQSPSGGQMEGAQKKAFIRVKGKIYSTNRVNVTEFQTKLVQVLLT